MRKKRIRGVTNVEKALPEKKKKNWAISSE